MSTSTEVHQVHVSMQQVQDTKLTNAMLFLPLQVEAQVLLCLPSHQRLGAAT